MELTHDLFFQVLKRISEIPVTKTSFRADNTSSSPDLFVWKIHPELLKNARLARLTYVALTFLPMNPFQEEQLRTRFSKICSKHQRQGEWDKLDYLLFTSSFAPMEVLGKYLKDRSPEDFFGNDLPVIERILRHGVKPVNQYLLDDSKVKYPKRKRGYDDKGHLPKNLYGQGNTTRPVPRNEEKEDQRTIPVSNQFFFEDYLSQKEESEQGTLAVDRTSAKKEETKPKISTNIFDVD